VTAYRAYTVANGRITDAPHVIECATDDEAIERARQYVDGNDIELWEGPRFIRALKSTDAKQAASGGGRIP
jgi:hypothetical protein